MLFEEEVMMDVPTALNKLKGTGNLSKADRILIASVIERYVYNNLDPVVDAQKQNEALKAIVKAWESLSGGHYSPRVVERWLFDKMKPAIDRCRNALKKPEGST